MTTPGSIEQQSASPVAGKGVMQHELADLEVTDREATADQRVINIGAPIPIVFCKEEEGRGGAWVSPPAGLYGAITDPTSGDYFAFGTVVSDGKISPIPKTDIYKGGSRLDGFPEHKATFQYSGMPTDGFKFVLQTVTPGDPGTPGTPGYWVTENKSTSAGRHICAAYTVDGSTGSLDVGNAAAFSVNTSSSDGNFQYYFRVYVNGGQVHNGGLGRGSRSYSGNASYGSVRVEVQGYRIYSQNQTYCANININISYTTRRWQDGDPGIPPSPDVVSDLPLFPGKAGTYEGMSCLSVAAKFKDDSGAYTYRQQVRCFVRSGIEVESVTNGAIGASSDYPDLAYYLLKKAHPEGLALVDKDSFVNAVSFCRKHSLLFNGVLASNVNLRDYLIRVSKLFMLGFVQEQGRFKLVPLLPVTEDFSFDTSTVSPQYVFDKDQIVRGSLRRTYVDPGRRQPFCALVSWRSQREAVFGVTKVTEVRYTGTAPDGPFEQYDLSEFCALPDHATLVAKYILSMRKHITHTVSFSLATNIIQLQPLSVIELNLDTEAGSGDSYTNRTFYLVDAVQEGPDGSVTVEATHFPVTGNNQSSIALDLLSEDFTIDPVEN